MTEHKMKSVNRRVGWYRQGGRLYLTPAQHRRVRKAMNRWSKQHGVTFLGVPS